MSSTKGTVASICMDGSFFFPQLYCFSNRRYALEVQWLTCTVVMLMYSHHQQFNLYPCWSGYFSFWLLNMCIIIFSLFLLGMAEVCFFIWSSVDVVFILYMNWEMNESCTESISRIKLNSSIIKEQIWALAKRPKYNRAI